MKKSLICGIAASAILLASCATTSTEETTPSTEEAVPTETTTEATEAVEDTTSEETTEVVEEIGLTTGVYTGNWESIEFVNNEAAVTGSKATINFSTPTLKFYGNSGVNNYSGTFTVDGTKVAFDAEGTASTLMMGQDMPFEDAYKQALFASTKAVLDGDTLVLSSETTKIVFEKNAEDMWETVSVTIDGNAVEGGKATFNYSEVYGLDGNAGVNQFFGAEANTNGTSFEINSEIGTGVTKMMGTPDAQTFEDTFLSVLPTLTTISLDEGKLTISNDTAKIVFTEKVTETEEVTE